MGRVTHEDKIKVRTLPDLLPVNKITDDDFNEHKDAINDNDDRVSGLEQGLINEVVNVSAIWTGTGLNYNVSADNFGGAEGGKDGYFSATADVVTLTVADGSDERKDRIGVFYPVSPATLGIVGKIDGIPGSGIAEDYDPTLFFHIRFATVEALATTPKDTSIEDIYLEDAGEPNEWVASDNTANIVQDSTNDPDVGTVSIEGTNVVKGDINIFTHSSTFSTADFDLLTYRTKLKVSMGNSSWYIKFFNSTTQIGTEYKFRNGQNNFVSTDIAGYQSVRIDLAKLNLPVADFDIMHIYPYKSFTGYFIDEVYLYEGSGNGTIINGVEEAPEDGNLYARINKAWQSITLGVGDMILASVQTVTGAKTFLDGKILMRNVANTFNAIFTNTNTADRTITLPDKSGTMAMLDDVDGDMVLADVQTVTGAKTFEDAKLLLRNVADTFSSSFTNTNTAARIYILPDKAGTVAMIDDVTDRAQFLIVAFSDETTVVDAGTAKVTFTMPNYATTLTGVAVGFIVAPTTSAITLDLNEAGVSTLSTKITVDSTEFTSEDAAVPPVISDSSLAANAIMSVDVDTADSGGTSAGGKLIIYFNRA